MRPVRNGPPDTSKAWIAGWDASITCASNPYKRSDYARAFERGRVAGKRSDDNDVRILNLMLSRRGTAVTSHLEKSPTSVHGTSDD